MQTKLIKVTDKGQISLPVSIRESLNIKKGDELMITEANNIVIMKKITSSDFKDLLKHSEKVAQKLWSSKEDDIWDKI